MLYSKQKPNGTRRPLAFFVPRQIMLFVEHAGELEPQQVGELLHSINQQSDGADVTEQSRIVSFSSSENKAQFSLIFADVNGVSDDPSDLLRLLQGIDKLVNTQLAGLTLRTASPNWLGVRAPHVGTGGPGAKPKPAKLTAKWQTADLQTPEAPFGFEMPMLEKYFGTMQPVEVAILDTAPCSHDLVAAYHRWEAKHPLLHSLLRPHGKLTIDHADYETLLRLADYGIKGHHYGMADHGLFVAGIVHTIAPDAELRLIEVLNPLGIGDFESIARGLKQVLERRKALPAEQAMVLNCSLVLNFPTSDEIKKLARRDPIWAWLGENGRIARMALALETIFNEIAAQGVPIAAAAGNDAVPNKPRPPARYPAAFDSVIGVSALEDAIHPASYANLADDPPCEGISTFGGAATQGETIVGKGVLGVYIGEFPDEPHENKTGWAWWAGTSFATPIVSGSFAALMSQGMTRDQAEAILRGMQSDVTPEDEEVISVNQ